jgi:hypothetical protein
MEMTRNVSMVVAAALVVASGVASGPARADVTKAQCIDANTKGQELRRDGKLTAAGRRVPERLAFDHAEISAPNTPGCTPGATEGGSTSTTGVERTVCCLH